MLAAVGGDYHLEIAAINVRGQLHLWTWDGRPLPATHAVGEFDSVFQEGLGADRVTPSDLDGDGIAELIVFDKNTRTMCPDFRSRR